MTEERTSRTVEWDALEYSRLANPHVVWGQPVLDRLPLRGDETVVDAGCGSGRVTENLLKRLPDGHVIALDISANMLAEARERLVPQFGDRVSFVQADMQEFELPDPVDAIFSTASLHWVHDHPRMFRCFLRLLKPGGRLVAQSGGGQNIARLLERVDELMTGERLAPHFSGWAGPWEFATAEKTAERLAEAGFVEIDTSIEPRPTPMSGEEEYRDYLEAIVFGSHLARIPSLELRAWFLDRLTDQASRDDPPYMLDYWRLNLAARKPVE